MDATYQYTVTTELGSVPSPSSGSVYSGPQCNTAYTYVTYSPPYTVTFSENSNYQLPSGMQWSAKFNGNTLSTTGSSIQFGAFDGTWSYSVGAYPDYTQSPSSGTVAISDASKTIQVSFTADAIFNETGLPVGTSWLVDINGAHNQSSTSQAMYIPEPTGVYSYGVNGSNYRYVAVPSTGQFTMSNNVPLSIPTFFVNNSTIVGAVRNSLGYFEPNWNYSSVTATSFAYVVNATAGYFNSSATGTAVLNNTTYSFTFQETDLNSTNIATQHSILTLVNSTLEYFNTSKQEESWNNVTTLNDTYLSMADDVTAQVTNSSMADYANSTTKVGVYEVDSKNGKVLDNFTSFTDTSKHYYLNTTATVVSTGVVNLSFTQDLPTSNISGYINATDPGSQILFTTGDFGGTVPNGTSTENFNTTVSNNSGTIYTNGSVTNYTVDPAVYKENFWWGYAEMAVVNITIPYIVNPAIGYIIAILTPLIPYIYKVIAAGGAQTAATASDLAAGVSALIAPLLVAVSAAEFLNLLGSHETTNHNFVLYTMAGYTWSYIYGEFIPNLYEEEGVYSDGYTNNNGVYVINPNYAWYFYPYANNKEANLANALESPHQSPFPPLNAGWFLG